MTIHHRVIDVGSAKEFLCDITTPLTGRGRRKDGTPRETENAAPVRCSVWFGGLPLAHTTGRSIALVLLGHLPVHEDAVLVRPQPAQHHGPLMFDRYLM